MILITFVVLVLLGVLTAWKLMAPEMYLRIGLPRYQFPWGRQILKDAPAEAYAEAVHYVLPALDEPMQPAEMSNTVTDQLNRMEKLLVEKNKTIEKLQRS